MKKIFLLVLFSTACLTIHAQLYVHGGYSLFNSPGGELDKVYRERTIGGFGSLGLAIVKKYYIGVSTETFVHSIDESEFLAEHPGYTKKSGTFNNGNVAGFVDFGYRYRINNKSSLLGIFGVGQYALVQPAFALQSKTNPGETLATDDMVYTGTGYHIRVSYMYKLIRILGLSVSGSYLWGNADNRVTGNPNVPNLSGKSSVLSLQVGLFFSFFNEK